jgi:DNA-binding response OmpR family regulator
MRKKRILIVDDEVGFTRLFKLNLEQRPEYEVRVENWADKALSAAREFRPDLVLLDVIMPKMIGDEVAAGMRADASLRSTPIIFLSALGGRKSAEEGTRALDEYPWIAKPASVEELIDGIEEQLSSASQNKPDSEEPCARWRAACERSLQLSVNENSNNSIGSI